MTGIAALLLEVLDTEDPLEVGREEAYQIRVTNQGTAPGTQIQLRCTLEDSQDFVSGTGASAVRAEGRTIRMDPLPTLAPKAVATWRVVVKAAKAGDVRFAVDLRSDQLSSPVRETEATRQY